MMKKLVVFILVIGLSPLGLQAKGFLKSRVDERMELLSIVMRLAGVPEYSNGMTPEYNQCVDEFFTAYQDHPVVTTARKMRRKYAFRRDAVLNLAVHLKIEGDSVFFDPALTTEGMDSRTNNELTPVFIRELDDFYKKTGADRFSVRYAYFTGISGRKRMNRWWIKYRVSGLTIFSAGMPLIFALFKPC